MSASTVRVAREGGTWHLRLDRPGSGNALSAQMVQELTQALEAATAEQAQVVVLEGEGRHFCTGFDLSNLQHESDATLLARFVQVEMLLQLLAGAPFRTVARAQGRTMGAGADLFAACDLRLCDEGTAFAFPGAQGFGLVLGTRRLAGRVGAATALDWVHSGRLVAAQEAAGSGLVTRIQPASQPIHEPLAAQAGVSALLRRAVSQPDDEARDLALLVRSAARPGLRARVGAYVERVAAARKPASNTSPAAQPLSTPMKEE